MEAAIGVGFRLLVLSRDPTLASRSEKQQLKQETYGTVGRGDYRNYYKGHMDKTKGGGGEMETSVLEQQ